MATVGKERGHVARNTRRHLPVAAVTQAGSDYHDLRRAFGTRWTSMLQPATLRALMRHESIETTLKYYVALDADDVADELWKEHDKKKAASDKPKIDA